MDPIVQSYYLIHRLPTPLSRADDHLDDDVDDDDTSSRRISSSTISSTSPRRQRHRRSDAISLAAPTTPLPPPPPVRERPASKRRIRFSDELPMAALLASFPSPKHTTLPTPPLSPLLPSVAELDVGAVTLPSSGTLHHGSIPDSPRSSISGASTGLLFDDLPTPDGPRSLYAAEHDHRASKPLPTARQDLQLPSEPSLMEDDESIRRWERLVFLLRSVERTRQ